MSKEKRLVPELRFPEFDNEWSITRLKNLCAMMSDGDWIESKDQSKTGYRLVQTGNIGIGKYLEKESNSRFISKKTFDRLKCTQLLKGDILVSRLPDPLGRACIFNLEINAITAVDCAIIRTKKNISSIFILQYMCTDNYFEKVNRLKSGSTRERISRTNLANLIINIPDFTEQQKIATFLSLIDKKIELLEKKVELLEEHKRGLLQKVFSQEIRFKKDDGSEFEEWKHTKLKEILTYHSSNISQNSIDETLSSGYDVYGAQGVIGYYDTYEFDKSYLTIIKDGAGVGRLQKCKPFTNAISTLGIIINNKKSLIDFLYYQLATINFMKLVVGSTIPHLYFRDYGNLDVLVPSIDEQSRIANFFNKQDLIITLSKSNLDRIYKLKMGLLQKMFI